MDKTKTEKRPDKSDSYSKGTDKTILKPITVNNVICYYYPILGTASYTMLSINVINPMLRFSFLTKRDFTSILLVNSIIGTGCYVYSRPHLRLAPKIKRLRYSTFGSILFSFSSVLLWALLRSFLPGNVVICSAAGLATSYIFIQEATNYLQYVDSNVFE